MLENVKALNDIKNPNNKEIIINYIGKIMRFSCHPVGDQCLAHELTANVDLFQHHGQFVRGGELTQVP
ncbi:hypothetical protein DPMN_074557 [Dreissena polymorpha]|uniref:Uncharacterized protein n=1 Tax=Dreissena polymorpha TaxID=45954 RepID=A0A9D3YFI6_DREPO|nr:hypothetical protein DPMN_074557 [Dreissena polymorpha]